MAEGSQRHQRHVPKQKHRRPQIQKTSDRWPPTSSSAGGWSQGSVPVSFPLEGAGPVRLGPKAGLSSSLAVLDDVCVPGAGVLSSEPLGVSAGIGPGFS